MTGLNPNVQGDQNIYSHTAPSQHFPSFSIGDHWGDISSGDTRAMVYYTEESEKDQVSWTRNNESGTSLQLNLSCLVEKRSVHNIKNVTLWQSLIVLSI